MSDSWEPRPTPDVTPETQPFWEGAANGEFLIRICTDCGLNYYYPRSLCPDCFGDSEWHAVTGTGTIYSYSVTQQVADWPDDSLPLVVAYIQLDEGPRVLSNVVECVPDELEVGAAVEVAFIPTEGDDIAIPVFELQGD